MLGQQSQTHRGLEGKATFRPALSQSFSLVILASYLSTRPTPHLYLTQFLPMMKTCKHAGRSCQSVLIPGDPKVP